MRETLAPLAGRRLAVTATVGRYGTRLAFANQYEQTVLLLNIAAEDGTPLCDHLWMVVGSRMADADLAPGDAMAFSARVRPYEKHKVYRRKGRRAVKLYSSLDYSLFYPSRVRKVLPTAERSAQP